MEQPKASQAETASKVSNPPPTPTPASSTAQTLPPQQPPPPPPPSSTAPPPTTRKRPLESDAHSPNSHYLKIRAIIRDLRPHFIEVLRTLDYKNCKASHEIREQLKILIELCKHIRADIASLGKSKPSSGENLDGKILQEQQPQHVKSQQQSQTDRVFGRPSEIKLTPPIVGLEKLQAESQTHGTYVVGGSAFGWNFITFSGEEPVYYGVTKEQFRLGK